MKFLPTSIRDDIYLTYLVNHLIGSYFAQQNPVSVGRTEDRKISRFPEVMGPGFNACILIWNISSVFEAFLLEKELGNISDLGTTCILKRITVTSHKRHDDPNHRLFDILIGNWSASVVIFSVI